MIDVMTPISKHIVEVLILTNCVAGCTHRSEPPPAPPRAPVEHSVVRDEASDLQRLAMRVQTAPDNIAEADALRQLRQYLVDHKLLYRTSTVRASDGAPIAGAAVAGQAVRATVEVLRGEQPVYAFSFVPKDNRDLALIGTE